MTIAVHIPAPFRAIPSGARDVTAEGRNVAELIQDLDRQYPGIRAELCERNGELHQYINVYVDSKDVRFLGGVRTPLSPDSKVTIIEALSGG